MRDRIIRVIEEQLAIKPERLPEDPEATNAMHLENDLGADSLDRLELVMALEEEFDIAINDDKFADVQTVGDVVKLVEEAAQ